MTSKHKLVALLPMKAHSSRISGKNFRPFAGKPLFRWVLDTLLEIPEVEKIVINTDARRILYSHGLDDSSRIIIRDRPSEICGDDVSMNRIIEDDLDHIDSETFLMTHSTNPLLSSRTISRAIAAYEEGVANEAKDSLFTVNRHQTRFYREGGSAVNHDPNKLIPTQDLEPWFEENSNLYIFSKNSFTAANARIGKSPILMETPPLESADIDDPTGWIRAELFALSRQLAEAYPDSTHD